MILWIVHIIIIGVLSVVFYKRFNAGFPKWIYFSSLILKLTAGIALGLIFFQYYKSGDTILFFKEASRLVELPLEEYISTLFSPSNYSITNQPRVQFFTRVLSLLVLVTGQSYWLSSLYLSLLSFFATWYLVITLYRLFPLDKRVIVFCFLFIPTVIFWSSGILKDSLAFGALMFLLTVTLKAYFHKRVHFVDWMLFIVGFFLLLKIKHYLLISIILFIGILVFAKYISKSALKHKIIACVIVICAIVSTQFIHPYLKFDRLALTIYENNQAILKKSDFEDKLNITIEYPTIKEILKETPLAIQIGLFRPALFDRSAIWGWFHRVENTILTVLSILSILLFLKDKPRIDQPLIIASTVTILILATLLTLSTPNFGTLVRYKNAFIPCLTLLSSILPYRYFSSKTNA